MDTCTVSGLTVYYAYTCFSVLPLLCLSDVDQAKDKEREDPGPPPSVRTVDTAPGSLLELRQDSLGPVPPNSPNPDMLPDIQEAVYPIPSDGENDEQLPPGFQLSAVPAHMQTGGRERNRSAPSDLRSLRKRRSINGPGDGNNQPANQNGGLTVPVANQRASSEPVEGAVVTADVRNPVVQQGPDETLHNQRSLEMDAKPVENSAELCDVGGDSVDSGSAVTATGDNHTQDVSSVTIATVGDTSNLSPSTSPSSVSDVKSVSFDTMPQITEIQVSTPEDVRNVEIPEDGLDTEDVWRSEVIYTISISVGKFLYFMCTCISSYNT